MKYAYCGKEVKQLTNRNKKLLINTALLLHKEKLEKKLSKEEEKYDKLCSLPLPPRKGIRGGSNTKLMARISTSVETIKILKEQIKVLGDEVNGNK